MPLKDKWIDKINDVDFIDANDINDVAHAVIEVEEKIAYSDITAEVGQTIVVKSVDENGKPTEWEAVDLPSGGEGEWELIVDEAEINEDVQEIEFSGINNYNDFLFMGKFRGGNASGFYLKINGRQVMTAAGYYFVHNHDKFNVTKLRIDRERLYYQISSSSQQLNSLYNIDISVENMYGQTLSGTEPITRFSFVLAKTESYFKAGSTYSLWGRKIANV